MGLGNLPINFSPTMVLTAAKALLAMAMGAAAAHGFNIPNLPIPGLS